MAHADRQSRQTSSRHESWKSTASLATTASTNGGETDIDEEDDNDNLSLTESLAKKAKNFWTTPSPTHILIVSLLGALAGGLALPVEIPVIRQFACEWYFNKHPEASAFSMSESGDRCQSPVIAKLAGEIIASARILNALISTQASFRWGVNRQAEIVMLAVLCLTVYSDMLSRFGRKPMFTFVAFCLTCSIVLFGAGGEHAISTLLTSSLTFRLISQHWWPRGHSPDRSQFCLLWSRISAITPAHVPELYCRLRKIRRAIAHLCNAR